MGRLTPPRRQISWVREEIVLACDLLRQNGWTELRPKDRRVIDLSRLLQLPWAHPLEGRPESFRNANSVSRKTSDIFTRLPQYEGRPTKGNQLDKVVLDAFLLDTDAMAEEADRLRSDILAGRTVNVTQPQRGRRNTETARPARTGAPATSPPPPPATTPVRVDTSSVESALADAVLATPTYRDQAARSGRHPLRTDVVHAALTTLLQHRGRASRRDLAVATGLPEVLLDTTLAAMRRLTNIEGYEVLSLDPDGVTIRGSSQLRV